MWLRDSMNQVNPYIPYVTEDAALQTLIKGVLARHVQSIRLDPYANAFNFDEQYDSLLYSPSGLPLTTLYLPVMTISTFRIFCSPSCTVNKTVPSCGAQGDDRLPKMFPALWEGKYELDTLCATLRLTAQYYAATQDASVLTADWVSAMQLIYDTMLYFQDGTYDNEGNLRYSFSRDANVLTDTQYSGGRGAPGRKCGLVRSFFRGSDDGNLLPFHIPTNAMAVVNLRRVAPLLRLVKQPALASSFESLADEIDKAISQYGLMLEPLDLSQVDSTVTNVSVIFAYEVDGYSTSFFMDDANIPSLLSLPYIGYLTNQSSPVAWARYQRTRSAVLSTRTNPYYFAGTAGSGDVVS